MEVINWEVLSKNVVKKCGSTSTESCWQKRVISVERANKDISFKLLK